MASEPQETLIVLFGLLLLAVGIPQIAPRIGSRNRFFGVDVGPGFAEKPEAKRILQQYHLAHGASGISLVAFAAYFVFGSGVAGVEPLWILAGTLALAAFDALTIYLVSHRAALALVRGKPDRERAEAVEPR